MHPADRIFSQHPGSETKLGGHQLTPRDLSFVVRAAHDVVDKWEGIALCLRVKDIDKIKKNYRGAGKRMIAVLSAWLRGQTLDDEPPSWKKVVWVVADRVGGDNPAHAERILLNYERFSQYTPSAKAAQADKSPFVQKGASRGEITTKATDLQKELGDVEHRWYQLGVLLGLPVHTLNGYQDEYDNLSERLHAMLQEWLKKGYTGEYEVPSWQVLVDAVEHSAGGENPRLAAELATKRVVRTPDTAAGSTSSSAGATMQSSAQQSISPFTGQQPSTQQAPPSHQGQQPKMPITSQFQQPTDTVQADWPWSPKLSKASPSKTKEHYPRNKQEKVKLTFEYETVAHRVKPDTINELYRMQTQRPHGVCVIISNMKFTDHSDREGTDKDEKNLSRTFRFLGYDVVIYQNCKAREIFGIFQELKERDFSKDDSLVCCILSHGEEGKIFGYDSRAVELDDITNLFTAGECPKLQGKPKLFFIQACRGKVPTKAVAKWDPGFKVQADDSSATRPVMADFFFGYATPPGHAAFRNIDHGSWYISELCQVFCTYAKFAELKDMHTKVNNNVGTYGSKGLKEAPVQYSLLTKDLYFF